VSTSCGSGVRSTGSQQHEYEINGKVKSFFDIAEVLAWDVTNRKHKPSRVD
jgi:hypothetical protein